MKSFVSRKELFEYVTEILYEKCDDMDLLKYLNLKFSQKGFSIRTPSLLMDRDEATNIFNISVMEQIALIEGLYEYTNKDKVKDEKKDETFNPSLHFSDSELNSYDLYKPIDTDIINSLKLKNGIKVNDTQWIFKISLRDCYLYKKNMLVRYNVQSQRKASYKEIGTKGFVIEDATIDEKAIEDIKNEFLQKKFTPNLITFNVLIQDGKVAQFKEEADGTIIITPNYNRNTTHTTYVDCIDGWHRFTAGCRAYKESLENGEELEGYLILSLVRMTLEQARNYVAREFKRSATDIEWLEGIEENDYTKMADRIIENIELKSIGLDNNFVGLMFEDIKYKNKLTSRNILVDALKQTNVQVNNLSAVVIDSEKMGNIITLILEYLCSKYFDSDYKQMLDKSYLLDCNMFSAYIAIANILKKYNNYEKLSIKVAEELYKLNYDYKELERNLALKNKYYSPIKISNFFIEKIGVVINE